MMETKLNLTFVIRKYAVLVFSLIVFKLYENYKPARQILNVAEVNFKGVY